MYSAYLLEVTFQCSDDPAHYCFARAANEDDDSKLMIDPNQRIENCSDYDNLTLSSTSPVAIQCFRYALNAKEALAIGGGLLAIFTVAMRASISIISNIWMKMRRFGRLNRVLQVTAFLILTVFNLGATIILAVFALGGQLNSLESKDAPIAQQVAVYLADNGVQFIIMLSTVELLLLINWEEFATSTDNPNATRDEYELN